MPELLGLGFRGAGHAGELLVHAEIILEGDGGESLILALDLDAFLGFHGLMQAVRPAAARHLAAGELVDDDDFAVFHDVIDVALVERVRAQRLIDVVHQFDVDGIGKILQAEETFALAEALFGECGGAKFFVDGIVDVLNELGNNLVDSGVLVGGLFGRAGNDQRSAGFVNQDGIDFIDDAELVAALNALREIVLHVVAEVVEAKLVVGAVS